MHTIYLLSFKSIDYKDLFLCFNVHSGLRLIQIAVSSFCVQVGLDLNDTGDNRAPLFAQLIALFASSSQYFE